MFEKYSPLFGTLTLTLVVSVLLLPLNLVLAPTASFIGSELRSFRNEIRVRLKMDIGNAEKIRQFPLRIGQWEGKEYKESKDIERKLKADILLLREYVKGRFHQPLFFLIMQSSDPASFHPPPICYQAQGWEIEEEKEERVKVSKGFWAEQGFEGFIPAKKLVIKKFQEGKVKERRIVLYFYVKEGLLSDKITMIRISALAPLRGSYSRVLSREKEFMAKAVPYMFEFCREKGKVISYLTDSWGRRTLLVFLFCIPLALIIYPLMKRRKGI